MQSDEETHEHCPYYDDCPRRTQYPYSACCLEHQRAELCDHCKARREAEARRLTQSVRRTK